MFNKLGHEALRTILGEIQSAHKNISQQWYIKLQSFQRGLVFVYEKVYFDKIISQLFRQKEYKYVYLIKILTIIKDVNNWDMH